MTKRKICVVTGTRAEYGLLYWLMKEIQADDELELQIIATGQHLSPEFGLTYKNIEADGFAINAKVEMLLSSDSPVGIAKSVGLGTIGFADALARLQPDIMVLLGDRFEALAAAQTAMILRIPIAHIHGGETTEGAIDEAIRHSITKMSQIHFVSEPEYRDRVIQLGENPESVFEVGAVGIDNIVRLKLLSLQDLEKQINFSLGKKFFLVTYHPETLTGKSPVEALKTLFAIFDEFPEYKLIFTQANSDAGGRIINEQIEAYAKKNKERVLLVKSLGQLRYLSAMKLCAAVVGNSSSGLLEAPVLHVPTINIGDRQKGRKRYHSVIDCNEDKQQLISAIQSLRDSKFLKKIQSMEIPHTDGKIAVTMKDMLKQAELSNICQKKFYDLK